MSGIELDVAGHSVHTLKLSELTYDEWFEVEDRTGWGMVGLSRGLADLSPKAWFVMLLLSIRRRFPDFTEDELKATNFAKTMEAITSLIKAAGEEEDTRPPEGASATTDAPQPLGDEGSASTTLSESLSQETIPASGGSPTSS